MWWFGGTMETHPPITGDVVPNTVTLNLSFGFPNGGQALLIFSKTATEKNTNTTLNYKHITLFVYNFLIACARTHIKHSISEMMIRLCMFIM